MSIILNGTTGITTPDVTSDGSLKIDASAPDDSLVVNSAGNVGIGTSSPGASNTEGISLIPGTTSYVSATGSNGSAQLLLGNNNGGSNSATDTSCGSIAFKARFNGTFGGGNDVASIVGTYTGNGTTRSGAIRFLTINAGAEAERARIDSSGNLLVGTTSPVANGKYSSVFDGTTANGIVLKTTRSATGTDFVRCVNSAGAAIGNITQNATNTVAYLTSSDYRLKENITPMVDALGKVSALKPVTYTWKEDGTAGQGFIAHELQAVVPDCVTGEKDAVDAEGNPVYQGIDTSFLVATLTAAIQEQQAIIDEQKAALDVLTARVSALEASNV